MQFVPFAAALFLALPFTAPELAPEPGLQGAGSQGAAMPASRFAPHPEELLRAPSEALVIPAGSEQQTSLMQVLQQYQQLTGVLLVVLPETQQILQQALVEFPHPVTVHQAEVHSYMSSLLSVHQFVQTVVHSAPLTLQLHSLKSPSRTVVRAESLLVQGSDLEAWGRYPALLVEAVVPFERLDVRMASNSMRAMIVDPNLLTIIPAGQRAMIVSGSADSVARIVALLRMVDRLEPAPEAASSDDSAAGE